MSEAGVTLWVGAVLRDKELGVVKIPQDISTDLDHILQVLQKTFQNIMMVSMSAAYGNTRALIRNSYAHATPCICPQCTL
jgi:hypothetical protein